jgi:hypothetical protein
VKIEGAFKVMWVVLLASVSAFSAAQPAISLLPQSRQPQISEKTKDLFRERWAGDAARVSSSDLFIDTGQARSEVMPVTGKAAASAASAPSENRANQKAYVDQVMQVLQNGGGM